MGCRLDSNFFCDDIKSKKNSRKAVAVCPVLALNLGAWEIWRQGEQFQVRITQNGKLAGLPIAWGFYSLMGP